MRYKNLFYVVLFSLNVAGQSANIVMNNSKCYMIPEAAIWPIVAPGVVCYCAASAIVLQAAAGFPYRENTYYNWIEQVSGRDCNDTSGGTIYNPCDPMGQTDAMDYILKEVAKLDPMIYMKGTTLETIGQQYYNCRFTPTPPQCYTKADYPKLITIRDLIASAKPIVCGIKKKEEAWGHVIVCYGYELDRTGNIELLFFDDDKPDGYRRERYSALCDDKSIELYKTLFFKTKIFTPVVGIEDNIGINSGPVALTHPAGSPVYRSTFNDHPPASYALIWNWQIYFHHANGAYVAAQSDSIWGLNQSTWAANVGSLPTGYNWVRDSLGRVRGEVRVETYDSDNIYHYAIMNITYAAPPAPPTGPSLNAPVNNSTNLGNPVQFNWNSVQGATSYRIQISSIDQFVSPYPNGQERIG